MGSDIRIHVWLRRILCFNSRSRMGSDRPHHLCRLSPVWFQFALPHGERQRKLCYRRDYRCFNSRSRMGSDTAIIATTSTTACFNSRSRMGSDVAADDAAPNFAGFNSRSRMGSDNDEQTIDRLNRVSIRAPAWGATEGCPLDKHRADVSIRAPAWGATATAVIGLVATGVSIRAPAWGATACTSRAACNLTFQFALPHGERPPSCNGRYSLHRKRTIR